MPDRSKRDVVVIGAGASGLFCAIECGKRGRRVLVLDHADRICAKVRASGGGRCNFTNLSVSPEHYLSRNPHFCRSALARFTPEDMLGLVRKHRIGYSEKESGQLFCVKSSADIVNMLKSECSSAGVELRLKCRIGAVKKEGGFVITTDRGVLASESLVIATGGLSFRKLGASGFGHELARGFGLAVTGLKPALVPLTLPAADRKVFGDLAGIAVRGAVSCGGARFSGSILFTHRGLSGPAILQASSYWRKGSSLSIDLFPETDLAALLKAERRSRAELRNLLARFLPRRFADVWCDRYGPSKPVNQYADRELRALEERLHAWEVVPDGTEGYEAAEATAGGIDTDGISSKTMEAKQVPGLYCIGEVLDVTGHLGGYNLHWAWASGYAAGQYA